MEIPLTPQYSALDFDALQHILNRVPVGPTEQHALNSIRQANAQALQQWQAQMQAQAAAPPVAPEKNAQDDDR